MMQKLSTKIRDSQAMFPSNLGTRTQLVTQDNSLKLERFQHMANIQKTMKQIKPEERIAKRPSSKASNISRCTSSKR
jgi:hypothetical protein